MRAVPGQHGPHLFPGSAMAKESQDPFDRHSVSGGQYGVQPEPFKVLSASALVKFLREGVQPPSPIYMGVDDELQATVQTAGGITGLSLTGRWLRASDGALVPFNTPFNLVSASRLNAGIFRMRLGEGFLLSASLGFTIAPIENANIYGTIALSRQPFPSGGFPLLLASGYFGSVKTLSFPNPRMDRPTDGAGRVITIAGATPAAGAEISETVPSGARWRLLAFKATFASSGAAGNRTPSLQRDDGANVFDWSFANIIVAAGQTFPFVWSNNPIPTLLAGNTLINPFTISDSIMMPGGFRIRTNTNGILAGDQWSAITYLVQEWIDSE
jgi:hypothetical protein